MTDRKPAVCKVIGQCLPRHRHGEFLKFLRTIDRQVPEGLQIHMVNVALPSLQRHLRAGRTLVTNTRTGKTFRLPASG